MLAFHPYADLFPLIEGEDFAALVADVKANALREKIVVLGGAILDGRNRYRAALAAGLIEASDEPDRGKYFTRFLPEIDGDPLAFVISKNLKRRHLTDIQRASIGGKIAKMRQGRPSENPPIGGISTDQAAAALKVAPRQIERARVVHEQGVAELRGMLDRGEIAVSAAERIARMDADAQRRALPNGARAIMGSRQEPEDSLDYFPTPPWATRAFLTHVLPAVGDLAPAQTAWEPACGEGHIAEVLAEQFQTVLATDIHDYGYGAIADFLTTEPPLGFKADWIITNPPFNEKAEAFVLRALGLAQCGVAMFLRLQWLETIGRYERIFKPYPPALIAQFAERVPLCKGRWNPEGDTATAYLWIVWRKNHAQPTRFFWIPPGQRETLAKPDDVERFTANPVIKAKHAATSDGAAIVHDPETGEIIEEQAADPVDIPSFLSRSEQPEAQQP